MTDVEIRVGGGRGLLESAQEALLDGAGALRHAGARLVF